MKVEVKVVLDVNWCDEDLGPVKPGDPMDQRICESVEEAVMDALKRQEGVGYNHDMEEMISCLADYAKATVVDYNET